MSDSYKNDIVPAKLNPAEIYLPNGHQKDPKYIKLIEKFLKANPDGLIFWIEDSSI